MTLSRTEVIVFLVQQLKQQNFTQIRSINSTLPDPEAIRWDRDGRAFFPDITALKDESMGVFSIVTDPQNLREEDLERFRLFSIFSARNAGTHFLVTHKSNYSHLRELCRERSIEAEILPIDQAKP